MREFDIILREISSYSGVPALLVCIYLLARWRSIHRSVVPIALLVLWSFSCDLLSKLYFIPELRNSMPVFHLYPFGESILLFWFFRSTKNGWHLSFDYVALAFLSFYVLNSLFIESIWVFNSNSRSVQAIVFLLLSFNFFFHMYLKMEQVFPEKDGHFWIVVAVFIYFASSFFSFLTYEKIIELPDDKMSWVYHNLSNTIKNLLYGLGIFLARKL